MPLREELLIAAVARLPGREELLVHLGIVEAGDRTAVEAEGACGEDLVGAYFNSS